MLQRNISKQCRPTTFPVGRVGLFGWRTIIASFGSAVRYPQLDSGLPDRSSPDNCHKIATKSLILKVNVRFRKMDRCTLTSFDWVGVRHFGAIARGGSVTYDQQILGGTNLCASALPYLPHRDYWFVLSSETRERLRSDKWK